MKAKYSQLNYDNKSQLLRLENIIQSVDIKILTSSEMEKVAGGFTGKNLLRTM